MTDQEITKIIAEKVMGWTLDDMDGETIFRNGDYDADIIWQEDFNIFNNDTHCMMAWDKFSEGHLYTAIEQWSTKGGIAFVVRVNDSQSGDSEDIARSNPCRRRAMCECMVKTVNQKCP